jgi:hypothetical protein
MNQERISRQNEHGKKIIIAGVEALGLGLGGAFHHILIAGMFVPVIAIAIENYQIFQESDKPPTKGDMPEKIPEGSKIIL